MHTHVCHIYYYLLYLLEVLLMSSLPIFLINVIYFLNKGTRKVFGEQWESVCDKESLTCSGWHRQSVWVLDTGHLIIELCLDSSM